MNMSAATHSDIVNALPIAQGNRCPRCGYCPHCGRGGEQNLPQMPQPMPCWNQPQVILGGIVPTPSNGPINHHWGEINYAM